MSRTAAATLIALGIARWPDANLRKASLGMLTSSKLLMLLLIGVGIGGMVGITSGLPCSRMPVSLYSLFARRSQRAGIERQVF
ncbi:MAG TPA: hypothetical protein VMH03_18470 [Terriglobales bacterium]|nr:hypothetical protein [Terriglobales bacterium]